MSWNGDNDLIMLKKMAAEGVMHQKLKSGGRGAAWQKVLDSVNPIERLKCQLEVSWMDTISRQKNLK